MDFELGANVMHRSNIKSGEKLRRHFHSGVKKREHPTINKYEVIYIDNYECTCRIYAT